MTITLDRTTRNLAIGFVGSALIIGVLAWVASPRNGVAKKQRTGPTILVANPASYEFGTISMKNGNVQQSFTITNSGKESVELTKLFTSCMCTVASLHAGGNNYGPFGMQGHGYIPPISATLAPNESATVDVTFDPTAHGPAGVGYIERTIFVENSAGDPLEIPFTVTVTP